MDGKEVRDEPGPRPAPRRLAQEQPEWRQRRRLRGGRARRPLSHEKSPWRVRARDSVFPAAVDSLNPLDVIDTIACVADAMRVALISFGAAEFSLLHETCVAAGHQPVVYAFSRATRPRSPVGDGAVDQIGGFLRSMPPDLDLVLPGSSEGLGQAFTGYDLDLAIVYGFSWKLPPAVLRMPRFGVLNIHSSLLPKYRGPAPVIWAIRNGDPEIGFTIHRMDENFDTGPILAQKGGYHSMTT